VTIQTRIGVCPGGHHGVVHVAIRRASGSDAAFLAEMLSEAMAWRPGSPKPPHSSLMSSRYIADWPKPGNGGAIAEVGEPMGAAWYRLLLPDDPGYGFVDEKTPEISIGVRAHWRGRGVGRQLLVMLLEMAREDGYLTLSLSVEKDNFAIRLYESLGFTRLKLEGNSWTMILKRTE
jgi:ribosomal protein S18 acetylase RimI-like enzyme